MRELHSFLKTHIHIHIKRFKRTSSWSGKKMSEEQFPVEEKIDLDHHLIEQSNHLSKPLSNSNSKETNYLKQPT